MLVIHYNNGSVQMGIENTFLEKLFFTMNKSILVSDLQLTLNHHSDFTGFLFPHVIQHLNNEEFDLFFI